MESLNTRKPSNPSNPSTGGQPVTEQKPTSQRPGGHGRRPLIDYIGRSRYRLSTSLWVPGAPHEVFDFFGDAANLERITPPWLHFKIITPQPIAMGAGTLIDYQIRLRGLPIRWRTEISHWAPPHAFVDQQLRGPYRLWHHEHRFEPLDSGTLCSDVVHYEVPGGRLIHWLWVRRDLERIFCFRHQELERVFAASARSQPVGEV